MICLSIYISADGEHKVRRPAITYIAHPAHRSFGNEKHIAGLCQFSLPFRILMHRQISEAKNLRSASVVWLDSRLIHSA